MTCHCPPGAKCSKVSNNALHRWVASVLCYCIDIQDTHALGVFMRDTDESTATRDGADNLAVFDHGNAVFLSLVRQPTAHSATKPAAAAENRNNARFTVLRKAFGHKPVL
jgi:hypothetical protein